MKKLLITACLILLGLSVYSQQKKWEYFDVWIENRVYSNSVTVHVDSGQHVNYIQNSQIKDESGKRIIFNSVVDALNYFGNIGWELVQVYITDSTDFHYVMKREKMLYEQLPQQ
jgi:hypothetical protein